MDRQEELRQWLEKAEHDLIAAEYLAMHYPTPDSIICFHCQQAAEKYLIQRKVEHERGSLF